MKQLDLLILTGILILGFSLRFSLSNTSNLRPWDERYHALVAKDILKNPLKPMLYKDPVLDYNYRYWNSNHVWLHKPPLTLWVMGASIQLFGTNALAVRLPSILFSTLSILLVFLLSRMALGKTAAFFAAFFFAIQSKSLELVSGLQPTDHVDSLFAFLVLLGVYFGFRWKDRLSINRALILGFVLGLAFMTKSMPALILLPIWSAIFWKGFMASPRTYFLPGLYFLGISLLLILPWKIWIATSYPLESAYESEYNWRHFTEVLEGHGHPWYFFGSVLVQQFGWLVLAVLCYPLFKFIREKTLPLFWVVLWVFIPLVIFSFASTKMEAYIFISIPGILLLYGLVFKDLQARLEGRTKWLLSFLFLLLVFFIPIKNVFKTFDMAKEMSREIHWPEELKAYRGKTDYVLFNEKNYLETMFFYGGTVYKFMPSQAQITKARKSGKTVLIRENKDFSGSDSLENVVWIP